MSQDAMTPIIQVRRRRVSLAWLVPIFALIGAGLLAHSAWQQRGVRVSITFEDAGGLRPGDAVMYRGIRVGDIRDVRLAEDLRAVVVEAELRPEAGALAREHSRFWVAKPEVSLAGVSGLETLMGPTYLNVLPRAGDAVFRAKFDGLRDTPKGAAEVGDGLRVVLMMPRRGTVSVGSPILYRDIPVGHVQDVRLSPNARQVEVEAIIVAEHAALVRERTRFYKASGIGVDFGWFRGLTVRADSLESLVSGAIAFATPSRAGAVVEPGHVFDVAGEPDAEWLKWEPDLALEPKPGTGMRFFSRWTGARQD
ncbi:MAG: MCE family protein [Phycisphaeraceae bacterium]|nr:MCE family protein [Phycisphaeraceae bacterium]MCW5762084.1 MCE family protein [Phycisphaeraceae bacterium]